MKDNECYSYLTSKDNSMERLAIILASSGSREEEELLKNIYTKQGYRCVVTGVAGVDYELRKKIVNSVVGACLNSGIIEKNKRMIHALVHATNEACFSIKMDGSIHQSFQLKIAIVRDEDWIVVAIFGDMAIHLLSNHKTVGIGLMHL